MVGFIFNPELPSSVRRDSAPEVDPKNWLSFDGNMGHLWERVNPGFPDIGLR